MSFREKSAWISLISILLVSGAFFLHVPWTLRPSHSPQMFRGLLYCILALILIELAAHLFVFFRAPEDPPGAKDEREALIDFRAIRLAHYVYVAGSLLAVLSIHHGANATAIGYGVLLALVIGEVAKNAARIHYHRRGF